MKHLRKFEEFINLKMIKKQAPDIERAKNLFSEADNKLAFFEKLKNSLGFNELSPNYVVEACYDIIIEIIRAKLMLKGYGTDSHEAEVSYLRNLGFLEPEVTFMNQLRYFRNSIRYYGKILDTEYAKKVEDFLNKVYPKLKVIKW